MKYDECSEDFGYGHIEEEFNQLKLKITGQRDKIEKHKLMQQIDEWEWESIEKIKKMANEIRDEFTSFMTKAISDMDLKLHELQKKVNQCRKTEISVPSVDLQYFNYELERLKNYFNNPTNVKIEHDLTPLVHKIHLLAKNMHGYTSIMNINRNTKWMKNAVTVAGGNGQGNTRNQLNFPFSLFVCHDQTLYITDCENHRIVEWKCGATNGQIVAGDNKQGSDTNQLNRPLDVIVDKQTDSLIISDYNNKRVVQWPRYNGTHGKVIISNIACWGLTIDDDGYLYVVDHSQHLVRQYRIGENEGIIVAGGNGSGNHLDQLCYPTYVCVDRDHSVYVSDQSNHRVMKWGKGAKHGIIVAGGQYKKHNSRQLSNPYGIVVDQTGVVYVVDGENNRIVRWTQENNALISTIICGDGYGSQSNQLAYPTGLSIDEKGNLYVCDRGNHRIQKFEIDQNA